MFRVVFICTGNRARSVTAEAAFSRLITGLPIEVGSAGCLDLGGKPPLPEAAMAANRLGLDLADHRSRYLAEADLGNADLVIGFEANHVAAAVVDGGADAARTFTIREFLRLLNGAQLAPMDDLVEQARARVRAAQAMREIGPAFVPGEDLSDPLGRDPAYFDEVAQKVQGLVGLLFENLFGAEVRGGVQ
jgi:protein-tyrosine phosphatase